MGIKCDATSTDALFHFSHPKPKEYTILLQMVKKARHKKSREQEEKRMKKRALQTHLQKSFAQLLEVTAFTWYANLLEASIVI